MPYRILLVEDENLIRGMLVEMLEEAGYVVVEASTGDEACELISGRNGFDVLLTDIQMPGRTDGIDLAHRFAADHPNAPIVFMTGRPDMLSRVGNLTTSEGLLRKPFRPRQMLDAIDGLLARHV